VYRNIYAAGKNGFFLRRNYAADVTIRSKYKARPRDRGASTLAPRSAACTRTICTRPGRYLFGHRRFRSFYHAPSCGRARDILRNATYGAARTGPTLVETSETARGREFRSRILSSPSVRSLARNGTLVRARRLRCSIIANDPRRRRTS